MIKIIFNLKEQCDDMPINELIIVCMKDEKLDKKTLSNNKKR